MLSCLVGRFLHDSKIEKSCSYPLKKNLNQCSYEFVKNFKFNITPVSVHFVPMSVFFSQIWWASLWQICPTVSEGHLLLWFSTSAWETIDCPGSTSSWIWWWETFHSLGRNKLLFLLAVLLAITVGETG